MPSTQNRRIFTLTTPLGADAFLMTGFQGREELSRPFSFTLDLVSENTTVAASDLVGQAVGWTVNYPEDSPRYFHGYVKKLVTGSKMSRSLRSYRIEVVPWLWFLTRATNCQIFQNKAVPDIITAIFGQFGFSAYQSNLQGSYPVREYCVQYRETAFNFISRLMEEYGIFYTFTFAAGSHTLVMADAASAYAACTQATAEYRPESDAAGAIYRWDRAFEFRSGKATHTDYNFTTPATNLLQTSPTTVSLTGISSYELFDYPGRYAVGPDGQALAKVRIEEMEAGYDTAAGESRCSSFLPGGTFSLSLHPADNGSYVLFAVDHRGTEEWVAGTKSGTADYRNSFVCAPAATPFRPARTTPRPLVYGPQPAVVVGPSGEEIYTDQYGRIKVQFFWDRVGQLDQNSSCWMRVAELWAGQNWGMIFTPRIGQEVIVEFLEGDPDQPLVTGRVYNANQMPPYALTANMTQSGIRTRSTKGGGTDDFNELTFEDKKGNEQVYFHAQKDFVRVVENDDTLTVGNDQSITIQNNRTLEVSKGYEKITIDKGDRDRTVSQGNDSLTISQGKRTIQVQSDHSLTVQQGNRSVTVSQGNDSHTVSAGNRSVTISQGNDGLTVSQGNMTIDVTGGNATIQAGNSITLKVGSNSIVINTSGITIQASKLSITVGGSTVSLDSSSIAMKSTQVTVEGTTLALTGDSQAKLSGAVVQVAGSGMTKIAGGVVMIN
ncbi:MAG TPA: type VI secretion system tip protein TssI/VgrG [Gemmata sp.]|nr:type VI secretion system tip protein TssI/VgrG [Gemmata sp.]